MISRNLALALGPVLAAACGSVTCPLDVPLSCHNTTAYENTCCFEYPGGQILQTQFWDTDPSTGPDNSWTIHGLWPDNCDGTYEQYCDTSREYTNISAILNETAPCTLEYMNVFWKDYQGNDESFWEHEWGKHGTCMSTFDPECYTDFEAGDEVADFFKRTVKLFRALPSYKWLAEADIVPTVNKTYALADIQAALTKHHGHEVIINCSGDTLDELWYHFNVRGSVQDGEYVAVDPVGSPSTCPATGIRYLPKYTTIPPTTTTSSTSPTPIPTGEPGQLSGKGRMYVTTPADASGGFLISGGTWYRGGGTPATYTATPEANGETFTLNTSKGKCVVQDDSTLLCASTVTDTSSFGYDGTYLTYDDSNTFYATELPSGTEQGTVYTTPQDVSFKVTWTPT